ncbi:hypothetical protein K4A83_00140 [Spirulina subsalsa FACHB-351]|uniref:Uncharacterized protein n=1 Tax=Spirulina subsalsa FACHB-351 TaxID=234711 RepID=A0ABT3KZJ8_9CYAN|nr:hypothetical protein [Spirulina subsalsa]MCW6034687.1 hypothetical protein [Spirulina subsalsa FACHB-351]
MTVNKKTETNHPPEAIPPQRPIPPVSRPTQTLKKPQQSTKVEKPKRREKKEIVRLSEYEGLKAGDQVVLPYTRQKVELQYFTLSPSGVPFAAFEGGAVAVPWLLSLE